MSKELLLGKANEILTSLQGVAKDGYALAVEQLPMIAQEYILYGRVYYTSIVMVSVLIGLILIYGAKRCIKIDPKFDGFAIVGCIIAGVYWLLVIPILLLECFKPMLMSWFAPKIFLITEIASLIK